MTRELGRSYDLKIKKKLPFEFLISSITCWQFVVIFDHGAFLVAISIIMHPRLHISTEEVSLVSRLRISGAVQ
jgi:hypothetical protein